MLARARITGPRGRPYGILDMFRFEGCYPDTQDDAAKLEQAIDGNSDELLDIVVAKHQEGSSFATPRWTSARWASFALKCEVL